MTNSDAQIPLDVLKKAYGASNHEDLRRKLSIEPKEGSYVVDGIKITSFYEAANRAHLANPNKPAIPDANWVSLDSSEPDKKLVEASTIEILLWVLVLITLLSGVVMGIYLWPETSYRYETSALRYVGSFVAITAGIFQAALLSALASGLGYLRIIAENTGKT